MKTYSSTIKVGRFTENDLKNGLDKIATEKAKISNGYKYVITRLVKIKNIQYMDIYLISDKDYLSSNEY